MNRLKDEMRPYIYTCTSFDNMAKMAGKPDATISTKYDGVSPTFVCCCMFAAGLGVMMIHSCGNLWALILSDVFGGQVYDAKVATYSVQQMILLFGIIGCGLSLLTGCVGRMSCTCSNWILCFSYFMTSIFILIRRENLHGHMNAILRIISWLSFISHCLQTSSIFLLFDDNIPGGRDYRMLRLTSYFCGCSVAAPMFTPWVLRVMNMMRVDNPSLSVVDPTNVVVHFGLCFALMGIISAVSASCMSYLLVSYPQVTRMDDAKWFPFLWYPYSKLCRDALNMYSSRCTGIGVAWANNPLFIPFVTYVSVMSGDGGYGILIITSIIYALVFVTVNYLFTFSDDLVSLIQSRKESLKRQMESLISQSIKRGMSSGTYNVHGKDVTTNASVATDTIESLIERPDSISPKLLHELATHIPVEIPWHLLHGPISTEWERRDTQVRSSLSKLAAQYHTLVNMETMIHESDILDPVTVMEICYPHIDASLSGCWDALDDSVDPWDILQGTLDNQRDVLLNELDNMSSVYIPELTSEVNAIKCPSTESSEPSCCYCHNIGNSLLCDIGDENPVTATVPSCSLCNADNIGKFKDYTTCSLNSCKDVAKRLRPAILSDVTQWTLATNQEDAKKRNSKLSKTVKSRLQQCQSVLLLLNVITSIENTILLWQHFCAVSIMIKAIIDMVTPSGKSESDVCCLVMSQILPQLIGVVHNMHTLKTRIVSRLKSTPGILPDQFQHGPIANMDLLRSIVIMVEGIDAVLGGKVSLECGVPFLQGCLDILRRINCRCELDTVLPDTIMLFHPLCNSLYGSEFSHRDEIERRYDLKYGNANVLTVKCENVFTALKKFYNGQADAKEFGIFDCNDMAKTTLPVNGRISVIKELFSKLRSRQGGRGVSGFTVQCGNSSKDVRINQSCNVIVATSTSCSSSSAASGDGCEASRLRSVIESLRTFCNCICETGKQCPKGSVANISQVVSASLEITPCTPANVQQCTASSCPVEYEKAHRFLMAAMYLAESMNDISNSACTARCCTRTSCCENSNASGVDLAGVLRYMFGCSGCFPSGNYGVQCAGNEGKENVSCPGKAEELCGCMLRLLAITYSRISGNKIADLYCKCPCVRDNSNTCDDHECCCVNGEKCKCMSVGQLCTDHAVAIEVKGGVEAEACNCFPAKVSGNLACIRRIQCKTPGCWRCYFRCYVHCGPPGCKNICNLTPVSKYVDCCWPSASGSQNFCDLCTFRQWIFYCSKCCKKGHTPLVNLYKKVKNLVAMITEHLLVNESTLYISPGSGEDLTFGCNGHRLGCALDIVKNDLEGLEGTVKGLKVAVNTLKTSAEGLKEDVIKARQCIEGCHKVLSYIFTGLWARVERLYYVIPHVEAMYDLYCERFNVIGARIDNSNSLDQIVMLQLTSMLDGLQKATQKEVMHTSKVLEIFCKINQDNKKITNTHGEITKLKGKQNTNWKDLIRTRHNKFGLLGISREGDSSTSDNAEKIILKHNIHQYIPSFRLNAAWYILWIRSVIIYLSLKLYHAKVGSNATLIIVNTVLSSIAMQIGIHALNNELMNDGVSVDVYSIIVNFIWLLSLLFTFAMSCLLRVFDQYLMRKETMDDISTGSRWFDYSEHQNGASMGFLKTMISTIHSDIRSLVSVFVPSNVNTAMTQLPMDTSLYQMVNNGDMIWYPKKSQDHANALARIRDNAMNNLTKTPGLIMDLYSFSRLPPCVLSLLDFTNMNDGPREDLLYRLEWYWQSWINCVPITDDLILHSYLRSNQLFKLTKEFMKNNLCSDSGILLKLRRMWNGYAECEFGRIVERTFSDSCYNHTPLVDAQLDAMERRITKEYTSRWRTYYRTLRTFVNPLSLDSDSNESCEHEASLEDYFENAFPSQEQHVEYKGKYMRSTGCDDILSEHADYVDVESIITFADAVILWKKRKLIFCSRLGDMDGLCTRIVRDCMHGFERFMATSPDYESIVSSFAKFLFESEGGGTDKLPHSLVYQAVGEKNRDVHLDGMDAEVTSVFYSLHNANIQKDTLYSHLKEDISSASISVSLETHGLWSNRFRSSYGLWFMLYGPSMVSGNKAMAVIKNVVWNI